MRLRRDPLDKFEKSLYKGDLKPIGVKSKHLSASKYWGINRDILEGRNIKFGTRRERAAQKISDLMSAVTDPIFDGLEKVGNFYDRNRFKVSKEIAKLVFKNHGPYFYDQNGEKVINEGPVMGRFGRALMTASGLAIEAGALYSAHKGFSPSVDSAVTLGAMQASALMSLGIAGSQHLIEANYEALPPSGVPKADFATAPSIS